MIVAFLSVSFQLYCGFNGRNELLFQFMTIEWNFFFRFTQVAKSLLWHIEKKLYDFNATELLMKFDWIIVALM